MEAIQCLCGIENCLEILSTCGDVFFSAFGRIAFLLLVFHATNFVAISHVPTAGRKRARMEFFISLFPRVVHWQRFKSFLFKMRKISIPPHSTFFFVLPSVSSDVNGKSFELWTGFPDRCISAPHQKLRCMDSPAVCRVRQGCLRVEDWENGVWWRPDAHTHTARVHTEKKTRLAEHAKSLPSVASSG